MGERKRLPVWVFVLSGLAFALLALWLYPRAMPISGSRLQVNREQAAQIAERFLARINVQIPAGYHRVTTFTIDEDVKVYLEQELGLRKANQHAQRDGFAYAWRTRWFQFLYSTQWLARLNFGLVVLFAAMPAVMAWLGARRGEIALEPATNRW